MGNNDGISEAEAIRIAEAAIKGHVKREADEPIEVAHDGDVYTVTFVHHTQPNMLGADYDAQVTVNAITGDVIQVKLGS